MTPNAANIVAPSSTGASRRRGRSASDARWRTARRPPRLHRARTGSTSASGSSPVGAHDEHRARASDVTRAERQVDLQSVRVLHDVAPMRRLARRRRSRARVGLLADANALSDGDLSRPEPIRDGWFAITHRRGAGRARRSRNARPPRIACRQSRNSSARRYSGFGDPPVLGSESRPGTECRCRSTIRRTARRRRGRRCHARHLRYRLARAIEVVVRGNAVDSDRAQVDRRDHESVTSSPSLTPCTLRRLRTNRPVPTSRITETAA